MQQSVAEVEEDDAELEEDDAELEEDDAEFEEDSGIRSTVKSIVLKPKQVVTTAAKRIVADNIQVMVELRFWLKKKTFFERKLNKEKTPSQM